MTAPIPLVSALTPQMRRSMDAYAASGAPRYADAGPDEARAMYLRSTARTAWEEPHPVDSRDAALDGVRARVYRRRGDADESGHPIVYLHGGGFVMGDLSTHDSVCRELASASRLPVVAVEYPLGPEQRFPAAAEFALELPARIVDHASRLGVDARRLVLAGDSAGACLAAVAGLGARERARIAAQCLFYPPTDLHCDTASFREIASGYPVTGRDGEWFTRSYLRTPEDADDWRASPLLAPSLASSPPTLLVTVGHDPLRDEGIEFGRRLEREGVPLIHHHLPGHVHGFLTIGPSIPEARTELAFAARFARDALAS